MYKAGVLRGLYTNLRAKYLGLVFTGAVDGPKHWDSQGFAGGTLHSIS